MYSIYYYNCSFVVCISFKVEYTYVLSFFVCGVLVSKINNITIIQLMEIGKFNFFAVVLYSTNTAVVVTVKVLQ